MNQFVRFRASHFHLLEFLDLLKTDDAVGFLEALLIGRFDHVVGRRVAAIPNPYQGAHAVVAKAFDAGSDLVIFGDDHAAFAGGHFLVAEKREAGGAAKGPDFATVDLG